LEFPPVTYRTAEFSPCHTYRYTLTRIWHEPARTVLPFVGLNPSVADAEVDDHTIRKCIGFARRRGADGIVMMNLFAFVSKDPKKLFINPDPVGPENDRHLRDILGTAPEAVVCWGEQKGIDPRVKEVLAMIRNPICLGMTKQGYPRHPSRPGYATQLIPFRIA